MARENEREVIWDATDVIHNWEKRYIKIIEEIKDKKPDFIVVPVGSGETFCGLYEGIKKFKLKTKLIGIGVKAKCIVSLINCILLGRLMKEK
jgi:1-aminocyclopropane-1-carboxylate deaminase/D-cysteine desulfhydrase-like pyridoxal-dependent ACC family enzyme